jgi:hypothetical protein
MSAFGSQACPSSRLPRPRPSSLGPRARARCSIFVDRSTSAAVVALHPIDDMAVHEHEHEHEEEEEEAGRRRGRRDEDEDSNPFLSCSGRRRVLTLTACCPAPWAAQKAAPRTSPPSEGPDPKPQTTGAQANESFAQAVRRGQKKHARPSRRAADRRGRRGVLSSNERGSRPPVGSRGIALGFLSHRTHRPHPTGA